MTSRLTLVQNQLVLAGAGSPIPLLQGQRVVKASATSGLVLVQGQDILQGVGTPFPFTETDTILVCGTTAYCTGHSLNSLTDGSQASDGGTAGVGTPSIDVDANAAQLCGVWFELVVNAGVSWAAGTWTFRWNVTTANSSVTWKDVFICRINSACTSQAIIGSASPNLVLSATGVKTQTVTGSAQTPSAGDKVMIVLTFSNSTGLAKTIAWTPNQNIASPSTK